MYATQRTFRKVNGYVNKDAVPLRTVSTQDALALACAAQRINQSYIKDTRRFS